MKKVLLYSGGLDSWLINQIWQPDILIYIDMQTEYSEIEKSRLPENIKIATLPLAQFSLENSIIPLRNLYLYAMACNMTGFDDVEICLGALNGDRVNDKTQIFADKLNDLMKYLYAEQQSQPGKMVKISMPFKQYSKRELLEQYLKMGGSLEKAYNETFSCYHPDNDNKPCLACKACFRKVIPFIVAGMNFTKDQRRKIQDFMIKTVLSDMDDYIKDKGKEGDDCHRAIEIIKIW